MGQIQCNLLTLRKKKSLKQTDLSRLTGISQKALSELETGKSKGISFGTLEKLCNALQSRVEQLFEYIPDDTIGLTSMTLIEKPSCSFCNKSESEVSVLVVGKVRNKVPVYICSGCIAHCNQLLQKDEVAQTKP